MAGKGCRFCRVVTTSKTPAGFEYHHPAINCCGPSAVLQIAWRYRDIGRLTRQLSGAVAPQVRRTLEGLMDEAKADATKAAQALRWHCSSMDAVEAAIEVVRAAGYPANLAYGKARDAVAHWTAPERVPAGGSQG